MVAAMVTVTDLGFVLSKEQQQKISASEDCTVSQCKSGIPPEQGKDNIYLCMVILSVDNSILNSGGYNLGIGPINSFSFHRGNRGCTWKEAAEMNGQCRKQMSGLYFPFADFPLIVCLFHVTS